MFTTTVRDFWLYIQKKAVAYNRVFDRKSIHANIVLKDLARFCRAHESTYHSDPRLHAVMEGRREVWLRIQEYLNMSIEEIYELHKIKEIKARGDNNVGTA